MKIDLEHLVDDTGRSVGYVHGEDGGYFFTWMSTIEDTLASLAADEVDGPGGLDGDEVIHFLGAHLPNTPKGKTLWEK
jgi:predicted ribonuclease YlaK